MHYALRESSRLMGLFMVFPNLGSSRIEMFTNNYANVRRRKKILRGRTECKGSGSAAPFAPRRNPEPFLADTNKSGRYICAITAWTAAALTPGLQWDKVIPGFIRPYQSVFYAVKNIRFFLLEFALMHHYSWN